VKRGLEMRKRGELDGAAIEFQKALAADPSSSIAEQELNRTAELLAEREHRKETPPPTDHNQQPLASLPPEIQPLSRAHISMKMSNDAKIVFDTIAKYAGLTMIYDPDIPARRITVDFNNVTLEQALEIVSLESKAVIKPVTENTLFVFPDQPQKRRDYEEEVVRTFYLSNVTQPQDITEIMTGLRQLFDLKRVQQVNAQNAIIIRDTPDKLILVQKLIDDIDENDSDTKIIQNPEIRSVDGQTAKLKIGQRIPVATGSFQAGVGVGGAAGAGFVNPLVNTQFTYLDVGVNVDMTPRVHPNHE